MGGRCTDLSVEPQTEEALNSPEGDTWLISSFTTEVEHRGSCVDGEAVVERCWWWWWLKGAGRFSITTAAPCRYSSSSNSPAPVCQCGWWWWRCRWWWPGGGAAWPCSPLLLAGPSEEEVAVAGGTRVCWQRAASPAGLLSGIFLAASWSECVTRVAK